MSADTVFRVDPPHGRCVGVRAADTIHDGSAKWERVGVSTYGPAPGFLTGGPNPSYTLDSCCPSGCSSLAYNAKCLVSAISASGPPPAGLPAVELPPAGFPPAGLPASELPPAELPAKGEPPALVLPPCGPPPMGLPPEELPPLPMALPPWPPTDVPPWPPSEVTLPPCVLASCLGCSEHAAKAIKPATAKPETE
jgi:hypothetical protein